MKPSFEPPAIIIGAWQLSAGHHKERSALDDPLADLEQIVDMQASQGPVAFDCADIYTGVEDTLGELLKRLEPRIRSGDLPRPRIHTKLVPDRAALDRVDPAYVERIVDRSLRRLGVERLDLVQFAWWDYDVPGYVECGLALEELRNAGKIGAIGVTNFDATRLREILDAGVPVVANQLQYSALDHRPAGATEALCEEHGVALLAFGTLAGGFLTDRWLGAADPSGGTALDQIGRLPTRSMTKYRLIIEEYGGWEPYQALLRVLSEAGKEVEASLAEAAIAYALSRPGVRSAIVGATRLDRWAGVLAAAGVSLSDSHLERIRSLANAAPGPSGPVFGLERSAGSPHAAIMKYDLNSGSEELG